MAQELVFEWPPILTSTDTTADIFGTPPIDSLAFSSIRETFDKINDIMIEKINRAETTDAGNYNVGMAGYTAMRIVASSILNAVYNKMKAKMEQDGENIDDYVLVGNAGSGYGEEPLCEVDCVKDSRLSTYEYIDYGFAFNLVHFSDFINMLNTLTYVNTQKSYSYYPLQSYYFRIFATKTTYTHKSYSINKASGTIYRQDIDHAYTTIFDNANLSTWNTGTEYARSISVSHKEARSNRAITSYRYLTGVMSTFSNVLTSSYDRYNSDGKDTATSGKYPSTEMGGLGTFDDHTDLSDISSKPSLNIADLGFFSIWNPTPGELKNLADFVWNDPTNWQQWPQIFQSGILKPLDYIISLSLLPIPSSALSLASKTFCMGGIVFDGRASALLMNLSMNQVEEQFVDINLGTLSLKEYFGSFLDYAPYSQISIYLPFYGVAELSMNELQNADSIELVYRINILDGSCAIKLLVDRQTSAAQNGSIPLKHVLYEYYTNVKTDIPLTQGANTEHLKMAATMITAAVAMAAPIAGAGAAALAGGAGAAASGAATMGDIMGSASAAAAANGGKIAAGIQAGANGAQKMVNAMPSGGGMQRGNISGMSSGLLSERRPFLIVTRPIQVLPEGYKEEMGYTASIKTTLATLGSGFVKFDSIDLSSLDCEESERLKILDLLTNTGVYI